MRKLLFIPLCILFMALFMPSCSKEKEPVEEPLEEGTILVKLEVEHNSGQSTYSKVYKTK